MRLGSEDAEADDDPFDSDTEQQLKQDRVSYNSCLNTFA